MNSIHPGMIATPMIQPMLEERIKASGDDAFATYAIPRAALPQEIANLALFLASEESSFCTGA